VPDGVKVQAGTGNDTVSPPIATDLVGGQHYQRIKAGWGADGVWNETDDAAAARFPVNGVHEGVITCTVASGALISGAVDLAGYRNFGLIVPTTFDGTQIVFWVSDTLAGTYYLLYDITNTQVTMTVTAARAYDLPGEVCAWRFMKIVCGTAQATTDTVFLLVARS
jgi:hypothetical protein